MAEAETGAGSVVEVGGGGGGGGDGGDDDGTPPVHARLSTPIVYIGQHECQRRSQVSSQLLGTAQAHGYELLTARITSEHFHSAVLAQLRAHIDREQMQLDAKPTTTTTVPLPAIAPLLPLDSPLVPEESNSSLIGLVSPWIDLASPDPLIAHVSRHVFNLELAYASFCGLANIFLYAPAPGSDVVRYARAVLEGLARAPYVAVHILLPMTGELELDAGDDTHLSGLAREQYVPQPSEDDGVPDSVSELYACWEMWSTIRTLCNYSSKLSVALELPRHLPPLSLQSRWYSEPVRLLVLPRTSFLRNAKGYPVLSRAHQRLFTQFLRLRFPPWVLLADVDPIEDLEATLPEADPTPAEAVGKAKEKTRDPVSHLRYLRHLQQNQPERPPMESFGQGYQDYIQSPLQPLTDNLESITYEVFEKDPVKYEWYQQAVAAALKDLRAKLGAGTEIIVAVVGAGRGPLVTRALRAARSTGISIRCCAVEKNPNAHVVIQRHNATDPLWNKQVLIYKSDMRTWPGPTINGELRSVDILVSELLGSFADNELSPECLDGVQHVLHQDHGINIPQSYSAHLTPIATPKLYSDILCRPGSDQWEVPAVVMLHQFDYLCTSISGADVRVPDVREAWSFSHPLPAAVLMQASVRAGGSADGGGWTGGDGKNEHNARSCKTTFHAQDRGVCHGLAGYFETVLYASSDGTTIELSTNPVTMEEKSRDMISWFPIIFPLKTPLLIPDNAEIEVSMWRQTDDRKVWYEWFVEVFTHIDSRRVKMAASELHSSQKNGCLM